MQRLAAWAAPFVLVFLAGKAGADGAVPPYVSCMKASGMPWTYIDAWAGQPAGHANGIWFLRGDQWSFVDGATVGFVSDSRVQPGAACPDETTAVLMPGWAYQQMLNSANVVTELQKGWDLGTVALIAIALLLGFVFGWRSVQRGTSQ